MKVHEAITIAKSYDVGKPVDEAIKTLIGYTLHLEAMCQHRYMWDQETTRSLRNAYNKIREGK